MGVEMEIGYCLFLGVFVEAFSFLVIEGTEGRVGGWCGVYCECYCGR